MAGPQSQTRYQVTVVGGGKIVPSNWALSGGGIGGDAMMDRTPGRKFPNASGGDMTIEPVTLRCRRDITKLTDAEITRCEKLAHVDNQFTVTRKPLDPNGNPFGPGKTWVGTLIGMTPEESDPNADSENAEVEWTVQPSNVS